MIKTFTNTDIIKYIYKQLNKKEKIEFENELLINNHLRSLCDDYLVIIKEFDKINLNPKNKILERIKSFSKSSTLSLSCD